MGTIAVSTNKHRTKHRAIRRVANFFPLILNSPIMNCVRVKIRTPCYPFAFAPLFVILYLFLRRDLTYHSFNYLSTLLEIWHAV